MLFSSKIKCSLSCFQQNTSEKIENLESAPEVIPRSIKPTRVVNLTEGTIIIFVLSLMKYVVFMEIPWNPAILEVFTTLTLAWMCTQVHTSLL